MLRAFPKDSTSARYSQDSNPGPPNNDSECLSLDHGATQFYHRQIKEVNQFLRQFYHLFLKKRRNKIIWFQFLILS